MTFQILSYRVEKVSRPELTKDKGQEMKIKKSVDPSEVDSRQRKMPWWGYLILFGAILFFVSNIASYKAGQNKPNTYFGPASCAKSFVAIDNYLKTSQNELSTALVDTPAKDKVGVDEVTKLRKQCLGELEIIQKKGEK